MTVKLQTSHEEVKGVNIECSPVEYMVIIHALNKLADIDPNNIYTAAQMVECANALYEEREDKE